MCIQWGFQNSQGCPFSWNLGIARDVHLIGIEEYLGMCIQWGFKNSQGCESSREWGTPPPQVEQPSRDRVTQIFLYFAISINLLKDVYLNDLSKLLNQSFFCACLINIDMYFVRQKQWAIQKLRNYREYCFKYVQPSL